MAKSGPGSVRRLPEASLRRRASPANPRLAPASAASWPRAIRACTVAPGGAINIVRRLGGGPAAGVRDNGGGLVQIQRRHVLFVAGFDPIDLPSQHRRFGREAAKFAGTWSIAADVSNVEPADTEAGERWRLHLQGPAWSTRTTYEPLDWHDVIENELARPQVTLLWGGVVAFIDFLVSGTAARYFAATWRYGLFFLVPFLNVLLFALVGLAAGGAMVRAAGMTGGAAIVLALIVAAIVFAGLMQWPGRRWRVAQALADWIFARDHMLGRRPDFDARLDRFADRLVARARRADCDELLVVGHSLGATLAVEVIARALARDPDLASHGPALCLLTVGATIPKLALHPAATRLRASLEQVAAHPAIAWTEYQARRDAISFYRFDPVALKPFVDNVPGKKPHIMLVGLKAMLAPETYRRYKFRHMRLHYQFVMGNERRAAYDYFMLVGGPVPFAHLSQLPNGALDAFGEDGACRVRPAHEAVAPGRART